MVIFRPLKRGLKLGRWDAHEIYTGTPLAALGEAIDW